MVFQTRNIDTDHLFIQMSCTHAKRNKHANEDKLKKRNGYSNVYIYIEIGKADVFSTKFHLGLTEHAQLPTAGNTSDFSHLLMQDAAHSHKHTFPPQGAFPFSLVSSEIDSLCGKKKPSCIAATPPCRII